MMMLDTRLARGRVIATAALLALAPACTLEQSVDVDVDVSVDADDADADASTGDVPPAADPEADGSSGEPADTTGEPAPPVVPECGDGVVEGDEECDSDAGALCELEGFQCVWRRVVFVSQARRSGWEWAADRDAADEACASEAAAAGLPVPATYRALMARDGEPVAPKWGQPDAEYRGTCTGAPLVGTIDPFGPDSFAWQVDDQTDPADWPACDAEGNPVEPPALPLAGGEWRAAWWTFTSELVFPGEACGPDEAKGTTGHIKAAGPHVDAELAIDNRTQPCDTVLPVLCVAVVPR